MPHRIQLSRKKGWRLPPEAKKVDRTTCFGNPFRVGPERTAAESVAAFRLWLTHEDSNVGMAEARAVILRRLPELRGKNLACWCPPGSPCHAEVLLELANSG